MLKELVIFKGQPNRSRFKVAVEFIEVVAESRIMVQYGTHGSCCSMPG